MEFVLPKKRNFQINPLIPTETCLQSSNNSKINFEKKFPHEFRIDRLVTLITQTYRSRNRQINIINLIK